MNNHEQSQHPESTGHHDHSSHEDHSDHSMHSMGSQKAMAASATLHCLVGCAIGEISGLIIGTAIGLGTVPTLVLAVALAFIFGYSLSTLPLLKAGLGVGAALSVVLAADTLSIATMELVDNGIMAIIPGAMDAGLTNPIFWSSMAVAFALAYCAAYPVNLYLLNRGKGHALTHEYHHGSGAAEGWRKGIPSLSTGLLAGLLVGLIIGGLIVSLDAEATSSGEDSVSASEHS